ncbi:hypothetical protein MPH_01286 [Macrophomina phaseolina MS6]|uniref:BTB domain-containing protein n=1 Tax=Macrophomina phaseolina (strain MS6) TaxID=1126212 RepID=K2SFR5_MACPH|nr:hypothetical protein MPH_01286 [Macrophomina phaseolina MS6]
MPQYLVSPSIRLDQWHHVIVIFKIGQGRKVFLVREGALCTQPLFFAKALFENWKQGQEKVIALDNFCARTWRYIIDCFYKGHFDENRD